MKRVILLAMIQAVVLFFIIGVLAYALKGDFFYNYLAVSLHQSQGLCDLRRLMQRRSFYLKRQLRLLKA